MSKYLFVHFTGEHRDGEQIYMAESADGLHFTDLNGGNLILRSDIGEKGVRDPFLVKHPQMGRYYLIATDLCIHTGDWDTAQYAGSRDLMVWHSDDLNTWEGPHPVTVGVEGAGCVWAPEAIWDEKRGMFMVFWASMVKLAGDKEPKQRIYSAWTKDFATFTPSEMYREDEDHLIDLNIVFDGKRYYSFVKDETTKTIRMEVQDDLTGPVTEVHSDVLANLYGVEGPECYQLPDGRWCLIVDQYAAHKGYLPLLADDLATGRFHILTEDEYDLGVTRKRHGGVLRIE